MKQVLIIILAIGITLTVGCVKSANTEQGGIKTSSSNSSTEVQPTQEVKPTAAQTNKAPKTDPNNSKSDFQSSEYQPFFYACTDEKGNVLNAMILGGYKENKWYSLNDFQYTRNGKQMSFNETWKSLPEGGPAPGVTTPLIKGNEKFLLFSIEGGVEYAMAEGSAPYPSESLASGQTFLMLKLKPVKMKPSRCIIGINEDWAAQILSKTSKNDPDVMSVDLNGDGKMEEIKFRSGIDGYLKIFENGRHSNPIYSLDLGE
jgi:hypothetical protein